MKKKLLLYLIALFGTIAMKSQNIADYNLLLVDGTAPEIGRAKTALEGLGHTVTLEPSSNLISGYDYSNYDAILFGRNSPEPSFMSEILTLNTNNQLGIVLLRGDVVSSSSDIGAGITYSSTDFTINNNSHYITQPFSSGVLNLGFTYKSNLPNVSPNCTILGSVASGNGSLVVHNTYRRVLSPYYGHQTGTATPDALLLLDRIIAWAVDNTTLSAYELQLFTNVKVFPNPAVDYIQLSGLKSKENYSIYNFLGTKISEGNIYNNKEIDIRNLTGGIYFLKFENGNTIKFIKNK